MAVNAIHAVDEVDVEFEMVASAFARDQPRRSSITKDTPPPKKHIRREHSLQIEKPTAAAASRTREQQTASSPKLMLASRPLPLLVCSIGNPGSQYANTLHSAGHTVLNRLAERLGYPCFQKERTYGNGLVSKPSGGPDWTLWQSTSYMNVSGKGVRAAYLAWAKNIPEGEGRLVIVYDELEKPLGTVSLRTAQGLSAKGHNGLKSIMSVIGNTSFARIGIGIGRPLSRESDDVARYVLKKMTPSEKGAIEGSVEQVIAQLRQLEEG